MKLKTLYRKNRNGKTSFMKLSTRKQSGKDAYYKIVKRGYVGSKSKDKIRKELITKGKNIGKANETTSKQQSESEIKSEYRKLLYQGWKEILADVVNTTYNTFPDTSPMPMLLNKFSDKKFKPGFAQKKYDGVRCIVEKHNGVLRLKSREGKIFNIPHILEQVSTIVNKQADFTYDGELYIHGTELHDIVSIVKNDDPEGLLNLHIYDVMIKDLEFKKRRNILLALDTSILDNIFVDSGEWVGDEDELQLVHEANLTSEFEGTILCDPKGLYDFGFRTGSKSKIKPRETAEFECVGQYWNKGKCEGQTTLVCINSEGKKFHVKLAGKKEQRKQWALEFDEKIKNKMITVEYRKLSKYKTPIEGVGVAIRDYE